MRDQRRSAGARPRPRRGRAGLRVEELETALARLLARGMDVGAAVEGRPERFRAICLSDPEGTPVRLFRWTEDRQ